MSFSNNSGESRRGFTYFYVKNRLIILVATFFFVLLSMLFSSCQVTAYASGSTTVVRNAIYHTHTGGSGGGGCYSVARTGTRTYEEGCGGTLYYWGDSWGTSECDRCGASYFGNRGGQSCPHSTTRTETYTYYELGCGKTPSTILGYVTYTKDTADWTKEVKITVTIEDNGLGLSTEPYIMNGVGYSEGEFTLTENGTYNFSVGGDSNSDTGPASYIVNIANIDHTAPTINSYTLLPVEWVREGVRLDLTDVSDPQPDGTPGCGLHQLPYSYDDGATWEDNPSHFYDNNGDYHVLVRDALENTTRLDYTIDNIDHEAPNIISIEYDKTKNLKDLTVTVTCDDVLADGRDGCGLDDEPYSYDGGKTWTESCTCFVNHNCTIDFRVRDKLGNENNALVIITNIDDYMPTVSHMLYPGFWTNGDVEVSFYAYDRNADGSDGIGLPDNCFSYDSGKTWTSENCVVISDNGNVRVAVRDKNDNVNYYSFDLINIDRNPPVITADFMLSEDGRMGILTAYGSDAESGIDYNGFIWDGGYGSFNGISVAVTQNGFYTVTGRDKAGNTASASVMVSGIKESILDRITSGDSNNGMDETGDDIGRSGSGEIKNITVDKLFKEVKAPNTEEDIEPYSIDNRPWYQRLWEALKNWWDNLSDFAKFLIAVAAILILAGIWLLFFLYFRNATVYVKVSDERYKLIGWRHIRLDNGLYSIKVSDEMLAKSESVDFRFRLKWLFVLLHKGKTVYFELPHGYADSGEIARYVDIEVR